MAPARVRELRIQCPDGQTKIVKLSAPQLTLGRSSSTELCFPEDVGLSRQHLVFEREGEEWSIRDLGSKNGTLLNSVRLNGASRLRPGDRISAGHLLMVYDDPGGKAPPGADVTFIQTVQEDNPTSSTVVQDLNKILSSKTQETSVKHMKALIKAGNELAEKTPLPKLFQRILDLSIEAVGAERGVLMTLESENELTVRAAKGNAFRISSKVRDQVLKTHLSILVTDTQLEDAFRARQSIVEQHVRTFMAVPLLTKDRVIGLIYVDSPSLIRLFTADDLKLLAVMANTAAIRIENARLAEVEQQEQLMAKELEQAAEIQKRFLPGKAPQANGIDLAGHNAPCRTVGGDYYDFFLYENGRVAMVLGDVSGKGMPAALLMTSLQARVQGLLIEEPDNVGTAMTRLNRLTVSNCPSNRFITLFISVVDGVTGELRFANAGHNPPLLVRYSGTVEWLDAGGTVLGILPAVTYEENRCLLAAGDVLVIFSDGVTEAVNGKGEEFGEARLAEQVLAHRNESSATIVDAINEAIAEFTAGTALPDDLTLLVARRIQ